MLFDPGPLTLLPEASFPVLVARRDFETAATGIVAALEQSVLNLDIQRSAVASALSSSTQGLEGLELAQMGGELARQPSEFDSSIGGAAAAADVLERELGGLTGELPNPNIGMPTPPSPPPSEPRPPDVPRDPHIPTSEPSTPGGGSPQPSPQPSPPPPSGDLYGSSEAGRALRAYADRNPNERARIERFLRDNPGDTHRAPGALGLPGWAEFFGRWQRGEL